MCVCQFSQAIRSNVLENAAHRQLMRESTIVGTVSQFSRLSMIGNRFLFLHNNFQMQHPWPSSQYAQVKEQTTPKLAQTYTSRICSKTSCSRKTRTTKRRHDWHEMCSPRSCSNRMLISIDTIHVDAPQDHPRLTHRRPWIDSIRQTKWNRTFPTWLLSNMSDTNARQFTLFPFIYSRHSLTVARTGRFNQVNFSWRVNIIFIGRIFRRTREKQTRNRTRRCPNRENQENATRKFVCYSDICFVDSDQYVNEATYAVRDDRQHADMDHRAVVRNNDDRPITPMRTTFRQIADKFTADDGLPIDHNLTNQYYEAYNDFEQDDDHSPTRDVREKEFNDQICRSFNGNATSTECPSMFSSSQRSASHVLSRTLESSSGVHSTRQSKYISSSKTIDGTKKSRALPKNKSHESRSIHRSLLFM
jgi:hypothetical protein